MDSSIFKKEDMKNIYFFSNSGITDEINLSWTLSLVCNYKCSYCMETEAREKLAKVEKAEYYIKMAKKLNTMIENSGNKKFIVSLVGGEISIIPGFKQALLEFTSDKISYVKFTTNLSKDSEFYKDLIKSYNKPIRIAASIHEEFATVESVIDKAVSITSAGYDNLKRFSLEIVQTDKNEEVVNKAVELTKKHNIILKVDFDRNTKKENLKEGKKASENNQVVFATYLDGTTKQFTRNSFVKNMVFDKNVFFLCDAEKSIHISAQGQLSRVPCTGIAKNAKIDVMSLPDDYLSKPAASTVLCKRVKPFNVCPMCYKVNVYPITVDLKRIEE